MFKGKQIKRVIAPVVIGSILLLILSFYACTPPPPVESEEVKNMVKLAEKYYDKQDYVKSMHYTKKVLNIDFRNTTAYEILALTYEYQHDFNNALETWHKLAFVKTPDEEKRGEIEKKILYLRKVINAKYSIDKAIERGDLDQLKKFSKEYKGTHIESMILLAMGDAYSNKNQLEEAVKYYKKIITDFPDSPEKDEAFEKLSLETDN